ncbi:protein-export protein SecB [bacterium BMS3Bbin09]|nr:protein-export protein SecB [bacterium BMS3Bbin09]
MQHNMSFDNFRIRKMSFSVNDKFKPKKTPYDITPEISVGSEYRKKENDLTVFLKVFLNAGEVPFFFEVESESVFSFKEEPDEKLIKQFSVMNCPAMVFPYVRETIADLTRRAGFPPLHLPPINFIELAKEKEAKTPPT